MIHLSDEQVIEIHDLLIKKIGGLSGIRDKRLLESALAMPLTNVFGEERYRSVYDKAAAYLFFITKNHPFYDGNKRTAVAVALIFLRTNKKQPIYEEDDLVEFVVKIATNKVNFESVSRYLRKICS